MLFPGCQIFEFDAILFYYTLPSVFGYLLVGSFTQNAFFIPLRYFSIVFQSKCATDVFEFECCALVFYSSYSAHKKKNKIKLPLTCLATKTLSVCEPSILIVVVVARAGLFTVRQICEWATYVFIYLFIFTLRYSSPPFVTSAAPHQCCAGACSETDPYISVSQIYFDYKLFDTDIL